MALPETRIEFGTVDANGTTRWPDDDGEIDIETDDGVFSWRKAVATPETLDAVQDSLGVIVEQHNEGAVLMPDLEPVGLLKLVRRQIVTVVGATEEVS